MAKLYQVRIDPRVRAHFGGKARLTRRFLDRQSAESWISGIEHDVRRLLIGAERKSQGSKPSIDLDTASDRWIAQLSLRPRTVADYKFRMGKVTPIAGGTLLQDFGLAEWDEYVRTRRQNGASDDDLMRERKVVLATAKWALSRGFAVNAEIWETKRPKPIPKVTRRFDPDGLSKALEALKPRHRLIIEFASLTGMRAGELRAAQLEWIDWASSTIVIPHSEEFSPKGAKSRALPIPKHLLQMILEAVGDRRAGPVVKPVVKDPRSKAFSPRWALKALRDAGFRCAGLHDLRHHYLSYLASRGVPPRIIQELGGHEDLRTTQIYMHPHPEYMSQARQALDGPVASDPASPGEKSPKTLPKKKAQDRDPEPDSE